MLRHAIKDFLIANREYPFICLSGLKIFQLLKLFWILLTTKYDESILYGLFAVIFCFFKNEKNRLVLLCGMFAFPGAICYLTNGHPYFQSLWMPVSLLCFVLDENCKNAGKKEKLSTQN